MKILFTVEFYEPHKGGAEEVVKQLAERLAQKGHLVTIATSASPERQSLTLNGVRIEEFRIRGNAVKGISGSAKEIKRYQKFLLQDFDIVLNYAAQTWTTDLSFGVMGTSSAKWILVPCGYSGLNNPAYHKYFQELPGHLGRYSALVYMSPNYQDKLFGDQCGVGGKAIIIPNGAAEEEFLAPADPNLMRQLGVTTRFLLISVSNHYRAKGHKFIIEAFRQLKTKEATLLIIGESVVSSGLRSLAHFVQDYLRCYLSSLTNHRIRLVSGKERKLVLAAYKNADLFLFGSQVEAAPLVMYESFAAGVPFITTAVGNVADHAEVLKIVKTPLEMAEVADRLLEDAPARLELASRANALWQRGHTWREIAEQYEKLFSQLTK